MESHTSVTLQRFIFQKRQPLPKTSKVRMAVALAKINRGTLIQGLNTISNSSKSVAKLLKPQLDCRLLELRDISHRLLREVNAPRQPLYNIKVSEYCINIIFSFTKYVNPFLWNYFEIAWFEKCITCGCPKNSWVRKWSYSV